MHPHSDISIYAKNEKECRANCSFAFSVVLNIACAHERERERARAALAVINAPFHTQFLLITHCARYSLPHFAFIHLLYISFIFRALRAPRVARSVIFLLLYRAVCVCVQYTHTLEGPSFVISSLFCFLFSPRRPSLYAPSFCSESLFFPFDSFIIFLIRSPCCLHAQVLHFFVLALYVPLSARLFFFVPPLFF